MPNGLEDFLPFVNECDFSQHQIEILQNSQIEYNLFIIGQSKI